MYAEREFAQRDLRLTQRVTKLGVVLLVAVLGAVVLMFVASDDSDPSGHYPTIVKRTVPDAADDADGTDVGGLEDAPVAEYAGGHRLEILNAGDGPVAVKVGGPVVYPPFEGMAIEGAVAVPAAFEGHPVDQVEVMALSEDAGFWGEFTLPGALTLTPLETRRVCVTAGGQSVDGATVRVALAQVGFLSVESRTDQGCASFRLPAGRYSVSVRQPGQLTATAWLEQATLDVTLVSASMVRGDVVDDAGRPLSDVLVAVVQEGVTRAVTQTDEFGQFQVEGVPAAPTVLTAQREGFVAATSPVLALARLDRHHFELQRGLAVQVRVQTRNGEPVAGAAVHWQGQGSEGVVATSESGHAALSGLPSGASLVASKGRFHSPPAGVAETVTLTLDGEPPRKMLLRIDNAEPQDVRVLSEVSGACFVSGGGRDWAVESCESGLAVVEIDTDQGTYRWKGRLHDALAIDVPAPTRTEIEFAGTWPWKESRVFVLLGNQRLPLELKNGRATVVSRENPLRVVALAGEQRTFEVEAGGLRRLEADATAFAEFRVVDDRNAAVTGAWVAVVRQGQVIETARSAGGLPVRLKVGPNDHVVAVDARRGQGRLGEGEEVLRLTQSVDPAKLGLWETQALQKALGVTAVADGNGVRLDVLPRTRAAELGILRGAWLVAAQSVGNSRTLWVWQNNDVRVFKWKE